MKIVPNKILILLAVLGTSFSAFAGPGNGPPQPGLPPPGLPIDNGIIALMMVAVIFGIYKIYQFKLHKKTPA
jgi:hypothetical protein